MRKRCSINPKQRSILDSDNEMKQGIYADYFDNFNLLEKKRLLLKKLVNRNSLTEWQAVEVLHQDFFMIAAIFKFGKMNRTLLLFYDRITDQLHDFSSVSFVKHIAFVANSLTDGAVSQRKAKDSYLKIVNSLNHDKLKLQGSTTDLEFSIDFKRIAEPVVISVPMTKRHTVYTEKDLFVPSGYLTFKGKKYYLTKKDISILDDHRGYYPLSSGYDWFTTLGDIELGGRNRKFGLNLTTFYKNLNSSITENGYWLDDKFYPLNSVKFNRKDDYWTIRDSDDTINLIFIVKQRYEDKKQRGLKIDYTLGFGEVSGYIKKAGEPKIIIEKMFALGEKRLTKLPLQKPYSK